MDKSINDNNTSIAIIGLSGKFPGAKNIDQFWENLCAGKESISYFSDDELLAEGIPHELIKLPNYIKAKGIIDSTKLFDADFFGITPREAETMDPQQRLMLECAWHALEDAGYFSEDQAGRVGVFTGASGINHYLLKNLYANEKLRNKLTDYQLMVNNASEFLSTRISYKLNLSGPSFTIQTACSTSLVSVCIAAQHLLDYQCDMAIAGGVSLSLPIKSGYLYQEGMIFSPDGHCRAFDENAQGTVPSNGIGLVVLKRLDEAIRDNDNIYAVIKGFAINNDGHEKIGFTAPSIDGQSRVISEAIAMADINLESIGYIETHGTATALGDQIEMAALKHVFNQALTSSSCLIGSVKTNIGHLDAAAGIAGLIKTILCLYHKKIPPHLHFKSSHSGLDLENSPFHVNTQLIDWKSQFPLRAGVSSFGIGGTNAHVILEAIHNNDQEKMSRYELIILSAKSESSLLAAEQNIQECLPNINISNIAYTLQSRRNAFSYRSAIVCRNSDELASINKVKKSLRNHIVHGCKPSIIFMFPGQGTQYINMAKELYSRFPSFKNTIDSCCDYLIPILQNDLRQYIYPDSNSRAELAQREIAKTEHAQIMLFIVEYALAELYKECGIQPTAMIGHSLGEYVAACLAGVFTLETALQLLLIRGRLMQSVIDGSMLSVKHSAEYLKKLLPKSISLAAINSEKDCVISGPKSEINAFINQLEENNILYKEINSTHAFHSTLMQVIVNDYQNELHKHVLQSPTIPFISNATGDWITSEQACSVQYWTEHLCQTVFFSLGITTIMKKHDSLFIEVGAGHTLSTFVKRHKGNCIITLPDSSQNLSSEETFLQALAKLWLQGIKPIWDVLHCDRTPRQISLPGYEFDNKEYWIDHFDVPQTILHEVAPTLTEQIVSIDEKEQTINDTVKKTWEDILGINQIDSQDNFFELGGDSLLAIQLLSKINAQYQINITLRQLYDYPTLQALSYFIKNFNQDITNLLPSVHKSKSHIPLSSNQKCLWFIDQLNENQASYNVANVIYLKGKLDITALEYAFNKIIQRHEILRTTFNSEEGQPFQLIHPIHKINVSLAKINYSLEQQDINKIIELESNKPFQLSTLPLIRASVFQMNGDNSVLILVMHHIITDGWSLEVLGEELKYYYNDFQRSSHIELQPLPLQYADYAIYQDQFINSQEGKKQLEYWVKQLNNTPAQMELPHDFIRKENYSNEANIHIINLDCELTKQIKSLSDQFHATVFITYLSLFNIFIHKLTGQKDIAISTRIANRKNADISRLIGYFANTVIARNEISSRQTFHELSENIKETTFSIYDNQEIPFDKVVEELKIKREVKLNPLTQIAFLYQKNKNSLTLNELSTDIEYFIQKQAKFDFTLLIDEKNEITTCSFIYNKNLYSSQTIERWTENWLILLKSVLASPNSPINDLNFLTKKEASLLIKKEKNHEEIVSKTIHVEFEKIAAKYPKVIALAMNNESISFQDMNEKANQLARHLLKNIPSKSFIGICCKRSLNFPLAILAILKMGCVFVPFDPKYPTDRLRDMIIESKISCLISDDGLTIFDKDLPCYNINSLISASTNELINNLILPISANDPAYVIFTSGTTGKNKAVLIHHHNVINYVDAMKHEFNIMKSDVYAHTASFSFSSSIRQLFLPLLNGSKVIIANPEQRMNPDEFIMMSIRHAITVWDIVPSFWQSIVQYIITNSTDLKHSPRLILCASEKLNWKTPVLWKKHVSSKTELINMFGQTETGGIVMTYKIPKIIPSNQQGNSVYIGKTLSNIQASILDDDRNPVPIGTVGQLYLSGDFLSGRYLNNDSLNQDRFVHCPHTNNILYKTGDIARYLANGIVEYIGRNDYQIKIRGYRIVSTEIEASLMEHKAISEAVVLQHYDSSDIPILIAFYIAKEGAQVSSKILYQFLLEKLPQYMIPSEFIAVEKFPLNFNGKVDRHSLLNERSIVHKSTVITLTDPIELQVQQLWQQILGKPINIEDNFFEVGGHSLMAVQLISRISRHFNTKCHVSTLFSNPTIKSLAKYLKSTTANSDFSPIVEIQTNGNKPPLFCIHPIGGEVMCYLELSKSLGNNQPIIGIQQAPTVNHNVTIQAMSEYYIKSIQAIQPHGPYNLCGWSLGGIIAHHMTYLLESQGEKVNFLGLIDCYNKSNVSMSSYDENTLLKGFVRDLSERNSIDIQIEDTLILKLSLDEKFKMISEKLKDSHYLAQDFSINDIKQLFYRSIYNLKAATHYQSEPVLAPIVYFAAEEALSSNIIDNTLLNEQIIFWGSQTKNRFRYHTITGNHYTILKSPNVDILTFHINHYLNNSGDIYE